MVEHDVLIIGGGLVGASLAIALEGSGLRIALVETVPPRADLNALHRIDHTYDRRIDALEFALNHDDGLGLDTLAHADIVLTGVSRTSKTPTSIYLAQQGFLVANVSLALGIDPPAQLLSLPPRKVVAYMIGAQQLALIRARRQAAWNAARSIPNACSS